MKNNPKSTFTRHIGARNEDTSDSRHSDSDYSMDEEETISEYKAKPLNPRRRRPSVEHSSPDYAQLNQKLEKLKPLAYIPECAKQGANTDKPMLSRTNQYNWLYIIGIGVIVLMFVGVAVYFRFPQAVEIVSAEQWLGQNYKQISTIGKDFPSQTETIWFDFFAGIKKVVVEKPTEPSVFLLLHDGVDTTARCLARQVASVARDLMNATRRDLLVVDGGDMGADEMGGRFVDKFKPLVEQHRVMVVGNLQAFPADVARSLHAFCDTVTPLVDKAVYIFTLNVRHGMGGNPTRLAETELNAAWKQLDDDVRQPLIVRITGGLVRKIYRETNVKQC